MHRAIVRQDGSIHLGALALSKGYAPGTVVEVILARSGSLIIAIDTSPPPIDAAFRPLISAGTVRGARAIRAAQERRRGG